MNKRVQPRRATPASPPRARLSRQARTPSPWGRKLARLRKPALALAALGLCAWAVWIYQNFRDDFGFSLNQKTLVLGDDDTDPESTALVLKLLQDNQADNRVALARVREEKVSQAALAQLAPALAQGKVPPVLLPAAESLRNALVKGEAGVYTIWVEPGGRTSQDGSR